MGPPSRAEARAEAGGRRLIVTVAGTTLSGFGSAVELLRSALFETNQWQHRVPDFVVAGPRYERGHLGLDLGGVLAAGYWGSRWEYREDAAYVSCDA